MFVCLVDVSQVKRLTMGLLRSTEECRPLVHSTPSPNSGSTQTISDGYVNEGICDPEKLISSKFGDSCRQSLTSILDKADVNEFDFKKKCIRETSSGKLKNFTRHFEPLAYARHTHFYYKFFRAVAIGIFLFDLISQTNSWIQIEK